MLTLNYSRTSYSRITGLSTVIAALTFSNSTLEAQTVSGTIDASITLEDACSVNGEEGAAVDFGSLAFGTHSALFDQADAQVAGGGGITVLCSPGVTPTFTLLSGLHDNQASPATHAMQDTAATAFVGYTLYTDTARTEALAVNDTIILSAFASNPQTIDLYGRAFGDPGNLPAGTYEDTLNVELSW
ncbi:spore coat U domain-containing protein [Vreelandella alkaliphila]|uniref:Csu type fimbrial protein n=1 Tax=Vreelandella alkaliphila TaxID=272774 RepID=UPI00233126DD|nr:spore coat U domain-containing protein [Halomonas alkaliphila]